MIDRDHKLPVTTQCQILRLVRSTAYYQSGPVSPQCSELKLVNSTSPW